MKATIAILTFNPGSFLPEVLDACQAQTAPFDYEILVIDSGSTDGSVELLKNYPDVRLHQIPNSEFGHGKTRNLAAKLAKGEIVVYITHDAVPAHSYWLEEMVRPFDISPKVAAVLGKQIPRPDCCPTVKRDVINVFRSFGPDQFTMIHRSNPHITDQAALDSIAFYSDTNSAARKSVLHKLPYRDLNYAEDQAFGRDVIAAGLIKVYAPLGAVLHSHSYPPFMYFRRMYDEMIGLKNATGQTLDTSFGRHCLIILRATAGDWLFILRDPAYPPLMKLTWLLQAPFYNIFRRMAIRLSTRKQLPAWADSFLSLEARLKKAAK